MLYTPWGYSVEAHEVPPIITPEQLHDATGGRFGPHTQGVDAVLAGVGAAIRNACGWHVSPSLPVVERTQGPGRIIALRTMLMTGLTEVVENGEALPSGCCEWTEGGLLRRCQFRQWPCGLGSVVVRYTSGIPAECAPDLVTVAAQIAANALAAPAGVRSEQAGDVSITYNQTGAGVSGGVRLLDSDLMMLAPYMLQGVLS